MTRMAPHTATAHRLDVRAREARARREAVERETRDRVLMTLREELPGGATAWLIGSLAWGGFGERSDVDVVVAGVSSEQATRLERALLRSAGVPVDLLQLEALPERFRERVTADGVRVDGA